MEQGFVHRRGAILYTGQDGEPNSQRIPVPTPDTEGRVAYQREWVAQYLRQKESEVNHAGCVTLEEVPVRLLSKKVSLSDEYEEVFHDTKCQIALYY